jgi:ferredoxin-NADP reductase
MAEQVVSTPTVSVAVHGWRDAVVVETSALAPAVRGVSIEVTGWPEHRAGQYVDVRVGTGAGASVRSYSVADVVVLDRVSRTVRVELAVQLPSDGSAPRGARHLERLSRGAAVQLDGPKGERLTWAPGETGERPLFFVAGGTGLVPLMAVIREWSRSGSGGTARLVHSVRSVDACLFTSELAAIERCGRLELATVTTRAQGADPAQVRRAAGRLGALDLELFGWPPSADPECFVCGPAGFVESVTRMLVQMGHDASRIRTEWSVPVGG